jgi:hypothetical protein
MADASKRAHLALSLVGPDLSAFNSSRVCALEVLTPYSPSRAGEIGKILGLLGSSLVLVRLRGRTASRERFGIKDGRRVKASAPPVFPSCTSAHTRSLTSCDLPSFNISTSEQAENPDAAGKRKRPTGGALFALVLLNLLGDLLLLVVITLGSLLH